MKSKLIFIIPIIIGIAVIVVMKGNKKLPEQSTDKEIAYAVRTITVPQVDIAPLAIGYLPIGQRLICKAWRDILFIRYSE